MGKEIQDIIVLVIVCFCIALAIRKVILSFKGKGSHCSGCPDSSSCKLKDIKAQYDKCSMEKEKQKK